MNQPIDTEGTSNLMIATTDKVPTLQGMEGAAILCVPDQDIDSLKANTLCMMRVREHRNFLHVRILSIVGKNNGRNDTVHLYQWGDNQNIPQLPKDPPFINKCGDGFMVSFGQHALTFECADLAKEDRKLGGTPSLFDKGAVVERTTIGDKFCDAQYDVSEKVRYGTQFSDDNNPIIHYKVIGPARIDIRTFLGGQYELTIATPPSLVRQCLNKIRRSMQELLPKK